MPEFIDLYAHGDEHHCCGCSTEGQAAEQARFPDVCRWDVLLIIDKDSPTRGWPGQAKMGLSYDTFYRTFDRALQSWNNAIGIRLRLTDNRDDFPAAVCKVVFWDFGGGVLADSHLADNTCNDDKRQRYDHRQWTEHLLYLTILHEVGHLIGLHHKSGGYVMNPTILSGLSGLTTTDISRAKALGYGEPLEQPEPEPDPDNPTEPEPPEQPDMNWIQLLVKLMPILLEILSKMDKAQLAELQQAISEARRR